MRGLAHQREVSGGQREVSGGWVDGALGSGHGLAPWSPCPWVGSVREEGLVTAQASLRVRALVPS